MLGQPDLLVYRLRAVVPQTNSLLWQPKAHALQHRGNEPGQVVLWRPAPIPTRHGVVDGLRPGIGDSLAEVWLKAASEARYPAPDLGRKLTSRKTERS